MASINPKVNHKLKRSKFKKNQVIHQWLAHEPRVWEERFQFPKERKIFSVDLVS